MRNLGRNLEAVAGADHPVGLALDEQFTAPFQDGGGFDAGMGVARDQRIRLDLDENLERGVFVAGIVGPALESCG